MARARATLVFEYGEKGIFGNHNVWGRVREVENPISRVYMDR